MAANRRCPAVHSHAVSGVHSTHVSHAAGVTLVAVRNDADAAQSHWSPTQRHGRQAWAAPRRHQRTAQAHHKSPVPAAHSPLTVQCADRYTAACAPAVRAWVPLQRDAAPPRCRERGHRQPRHSTWLPQPPTRTTAAQHATITTGCTSHAPTRCCAKEQPCHTASCADERHGAGTLANASVPARSAHATATLGRRNAPCAHAPTRVPVCAK